MFVPRAASGHATRRGFSLLRVHQRLAAFRAPTAQELAPILRGHTGTEADLADALDLGGLPSHLHSLFPLVLRPKITNEKKEYQSFVMQSSQSG